jgi:uncharacterized protein
MAEHSSRQLVLTFLDAYYAEDVVRAQECCDEAFISITHAPVEIFPHLGFKQGRAWLADAIRTQQERYLTRSYILKFIAAEGERVSTIVEATMAKRNDKRVVNLTIAEYFTVRAGLIVEHHAFFDSLDLLQQLLGRDLTDNFAASAKDAMRRRPLEVGT